MAVGSDLHTVHGTRMKMEGGPSALGIGKVDIISVSGLGFNGVVIDLQHHFMICLNFQNLHKFRTEIYDIVAESAQLRAIESRSSHRGSSTGKMEAYLELSKASQYPFPIQRIKHHEC